MHTRPHLNSKTAARKAFRDSFTRVLLGNNEHAFQIFVKKHSRPGTSKTWTLK